MPKASVRPFPIPMRLASLAGSFVVLALFSTPALAVEGGAGVYILGSRLTAGAIVPPPGLYFQQGLYIYSGSADGDIARAGRLDFDLDATARVGLSSLLWAPGTEPILGGRPYFSGTLVYGYKEVELGATLIGPGGASARCGRPTTTTATC